MSFHLVMGIVDSVGKNVTTEDKQSKYRNENSEWNPLIRSRKHVKHGWRWQKPSNSSHYIWVRTVRLTLNVLAFFFGVRHLTNIHSERPGPFITNQDSDLSWRLTLPSFWKAFARDQRWGRSLIPRPLLATNIRACPNEFAWSHVLVARAANSVLDYPLDFVS